MSDPLVKWLRPLVEARKAAAEAATRGPWTAKPVVYGPPEDGWGEPDTWEIVAEGKTVVSHQTHEGGGIHTEADARHIADNDPRQIIADCEADLLTLDEHSPVDHGYLGTFCATCSGRGEISGEPEGDPYPCRTVRLLAWGYRRLDPTGYAAVAGDWTP